MKRGCGGVSGRAEVPIRGDLRKTWQFTSFD